MKDFTFDFSWTRVQSSETESYSFPSNLTKFLKAKYSNPAIYRWLVLHEEKPIKVYYGEAEVLWRRINDYKRGNKGQPTAARIKQILLELQGHHDVYLEILRFESFSINGVVIDQRALGRKEVRCFIENALILTLPSGTDLLNKVASIEAKQTKRAVEMFQKLSPLEQKQLISYLASEVEKRKT